MSYSLCDMSHGTLDLGKAHDLSSPHPHFSSLRTPLLLLLQGLSGDALTALLAFEETTSYLGDLQYFLSKWAEEGEHLETYAAARPRLLQVWLQCRRVQCACTWMGCAPRMQCRKCRGCACRTRQEVADWLLGMRHKAGGGVEVSQLFAIFRTFSAIFLSCPSYVPPFHVAACSALRTSVAPAAYGVAIFPRFPRIFPQFFAVAFDPPAILPALLHKDDECCTAAAL